MSEVEKVAEFLDLATIRRLRRAFRATNTGQASKSSNPDLSASKKEDREAEPTGEQQAMMRRRAVGETG